MLEPGYCWEDVGVFGFSLVSVRLLLDHHYIPHQAAKASCVNSNRSIRTGLRQRATAHRRERKSAKIGKSRPCATWDRWVKADWSRVNSPSDFVSRGSDDWPFQCLPHQSVFGGGCCQAGAVGAGGCCFFLFLLLFFSIFFRCLKF